MKISGAKDGANDSRGNSLWSEIALERRGSIAPRGTVGYCHPAMRGICSVLRNFNTAVVPSDRHHLRTEHMDIWNMPDDAAPKRRMMKQEDWEDWHERHAVADVRYLSSGLISESPPQHISLSCTSGSRATSQASQTAYARSFGAVSIDACKLACLSLGASPLLPVGVVALSLPDIFADADFPSMRLPFQQGTIGSCLHR